MGWLLNYTIVCIATSFIVVKILEYLFAGVYGSFVSVAKFVIFVLAWTLVTTQAGMHGFTRRVRQLRHRATLFSGK